MRDPIPRPPIQRFDSGVMMSALTGENPKVTHFLFLAASAQAGMYRDKSAYGWWLMTPDGNRMCGGNSTLASPVRAWLTSALLSAALEAVPNVPEGGRLHVVSNLRDS